jgi:hypothetical protein
MRSASESADDKRIRFEGIVRREWVQRVSKAAVTRYGEDLESVWRFVAHGILRELWPERVRSVALRRGMPRPTLWVEPDPVAYLELWFDAAPLIQLRAVVVEMLIDDVSYHPGPGASALEMAAGLYGVERPTEAVADYLQALEESDG